MIEKKKSKILVFKQADIQSEFEQFGVMVIQEKLRLKARRLAFLRNIL